MPQKKRQIRYPAMSEEDSKNYTQRRVSLNQRNFLSPEEIDLFTLKKFLLNQHFVLKIWEIIE